MKQPTIQYEDNDIIVCHKPADMATQTKRLGQLDLESWLRNYRVSKKEPSYIGIIHRLDQPVEGLLVFAKNKQAGAALSKQVQTHQLGKHYYALVEIRPKSKELCKEKAKGTLEHYLFFDKAKNQTIVYDTEEQKDVKLQKAILEYEVIKVCQDKAIMDITLHTGRHHQIRAQLAHIGCPICGDTKYGEKNSCMQLQLYSYQLELMHPISNKRMEFAIEGQLDNLCENLLRWQKYE